MAVDLTIRTWEHRDEDGRFVRTTRVTGSIGLDVSFPPPPAGPFAQIIQTPGTPGPKPQGAPHA